eukprot:CAMPEP_0168484376 /NCGR_PEP_ID=MMETSP0228-20121227/66067_1 /TAXON_ID=133427 /ORGANISM="Protoceratium reticulatum, Strain CCCM 535 (=CCMP 1889)" /LENGTH=54 /DNA_ID=CAMNT_0008500917 /DNA_START=87 /DNA_END=248 /DNA_ORIENTATION=+
MHMQPEHILNSRGNWSASAEEFRPPNASDASSGVTEPGGRPKARPSQAAALGSS